MPQLQHPQYVLSMPRSLVTHTPWPQPPQFQYCVGHQQTGVTAVFQALYLSTFHKWRDVTWGKEEQLSERRQEVKRQQAGKMKGRKDEVVVRPTLLTHTHTQKNNPLWLGGHQSREQSLFNLYWCHLLTLFLPLPFNSSCPASVSAAFLNPLSLFLCLANSNPPLYTL